MLLSGMLLPLTVSSFIKIQIGFTFLVPAHLGSPGKEPFNGCVCVYVNGARQQLIDVSYLPGAQQQTHCVLLLWSIDGTDRQTDGHQTIT